MGPLEVSYSCPWFISVPLQLVSSGTCLFEFWISSRCSTVFPSNLFQNLTTLVENYLYIYYILLYIIFYILLYVIFIYIIICYIYILYICIHIVDIKLDGFSVVATHVHLPFTTNLQEKSSSILSIASCQLTTSVRSLFSSVPLQLNKPFLPVPHSIYLGTIW